MTNTCDFCRKPLKECLKNFEASIYGIKKNRHFLDETFTNLNDAIEWAKMKRNDFSRNSIIDDNLVILRIYQGCDRENEIYSTILD